MLFRTHLLFSLLIGTLVFQYFDFNPYLFVALVVIGGMIPDIDKGSSKINNMLKVTKPISFVTRHRGFFHSLLFGVLIAAIVISYFNKPAGIALLIGFLSHILIDGLNHAGVNLIHPLQKLHISGPIETGSLSEHIITIIIAIFFLIRMKMLMF